MGDAAEAKAQKQPSPSPCSTWMPDQKFWASLPLPVRFTSRESRNAYEISASVPGLRAEDVEMRLSQDATLLDISGLRLPNAAESAELQRRLRLQLQNASSAMLREACTRIAHGTLGSFAETVRVP